MNDNVNPDIETTTHGKKRRKDVKFNPDEVANNASDSKSGASGRRFKSAPKTLIGYITGRDQCDSMVKYLPQKPVISVDIYNLRMSNIYDQIGKTSTVEDITKINQFNNYMRRINVELVYEDE